MNIFGMQCHFKWKCKSSPEYDKMLRNLSSDFIALQMNLHVPIFRKISFTKIFYFTVDKLLKSQISLKYQTNKHSSLNSFFSIFPSFSTVLQSIYGPHT